MRFSEWFSEWMKQRSRTEVGAALGFSGATVWRMEHGDVVPRDEDIVRIVEIVASESPGTDEDALTRSFELWRDEDLAAGAKRLSKRTGYHLRKKSTVSTGGKRDEGARPDQKPVALPELPVSTVQVQVNGLTVSGSVADVRKLLGVK